MKICWTDVTIYLVNISFLKCYCIYICLIKQLYVLKISYFWNIITSYYVNFSSSRIYKWRFDIRGRFRSNIQSGPVPFPLGQWQHQGVGTYLQRQVLPCRGTVPPDFISQNCKVHFTRTLIKVINFKVQHSIIFFFQLHIVHYNTKYPSLTEAVDKVDGLAVLGFFIEVSEFLRIINKF